jgi:peptidoglycan/LPS O-acetylase OafA/YrhL
LLPSEFAELGKSVAAQQLVLSNLFFWRNTGYFDGPSDYKPLLHTWSLAVEEQFYLIYPFLLMLLSRFGKRTMWMFLGSIALGSFALSQIGVSRFPSATFFLLPTRAWELLIGGLLWFLPRHQTVSDRHSEWLSWFSLLSILAAGWLYTSQTPFPGAAAFIPCAATAALIYLNAHKLSGPGRILASRPLVGIGKISYSLYLWHWPILAFGKSILDSFGKTEGFIALLLSFPISLISWRYIETYFRKGGPSVGPGRIALATLVGTCLIGGIGYWINRE